MQDDVIFSENRSTLTARIIRDIDHHSAKPIREKIDRELFKVKPELLVLDFSEVRFMDSSGIGLIMGRCEVAEELSARVRIISLSATLMKIVRLSGIEKIVNLSVG